MKKYIINKAQSDELYKSLKFIHDTFTKAKIRYFMVGGTLLGALRHNGILPWDDDGDLCIFKEDVPKLRKLVPYFKKHGYDLEEGLKDDEDDKKDAECVKRKDSCTWFIGCNRKNCLGVDLFVMYEDTKNKINYYDPYWETAPNGGERCYFSKELMFPLVPYRFGNFYLYGPNNALEHLNRCYGPDWVNKGRVLFDHRAGVFRNTKPRELTVQEFLTFPPPESTEEKRVPPIIEAGKQKYYGDKSLRRKIKKSARKSRKVRKSLRKSRKVKK